MDPEIKHLKNLLVYYELVVYYEIKGSKLVV